MLRTISRLCDSKNLRPHGGFSRLQFSTESTSSSGATSSQEGQDHAEQDADETVRTSLLEGALGLVPEEGWSRRALERAAVERGLSASAAGILERGEGDLVEYFVRRCNAQLNEDLAVMAEELGKMPIRERIRWSVQRRLEMVQPHIDSWPQALAIQAHPRNAPSSTRLLCQMVDDIWRAAGDTSTDYNWYTKRALLAGVYTSSELYMLTDGSPGFVDTYAALDRRLEEVLTVGKTLGQLLGKRK